MKQIVDLHTHSKYSRACSKHLELPTIAKTCEIRGIDIVVTGDMTHPKWFSSIENELEETTEGIYALKSKESNTKFVLGTEIASIKKHKGKTRRVHLLILSPSIEATKKLNTVLANRGFNLTADGRPILGMTSRDILELILDVDERMVMIPAHAWTPWFGILGSKGGYDSLVDAFDDLHEHVFAIETGLSSDPLMNWRCSFLDDISMISCSDAHSPQKLGREACVFDFKSEQKITYSELIRIIKQQNKKEFLYTIEFYPEEGKYHMDGHRDCNVVLHPTETKKQKGLCPVCRKPLVIGVMNRVDELADRTEEQAKVYGEKNRIPYRSLVPLPEILADVFGCGVATRKVQTAYNELLEKNKSEFDILLHADLTNIENQNTPLIAQAIKRVREGNIVIKPGYDGVFGVVQVFEKDVDKTGAQKSLFA